MYKLSRDDILLAVGEFMDIVNGIEDEEKKKAILNLLDHVDERFFTAPASGRVTYHNCFPGGLVEHSIRVYKNLKILVENFCDDQIHEDEIIVAGLFHDLGKIGSINEPYYVDQDSDWHQEKLGEYYTHNDNLTYMGTAQRSLFLLNYFGVPLNEIETQAILIHDGQYVDANKPYKQKEEMLSLLLHQADMISCKQEERRYWKMVNG